VPTTVRLISGLLPLVRNISNHFSCASTEGNVDEHPPPLAAANSSGDPDFGPNVFIYDPSTPTATIQDKLNQLHDQQVNDRFSNSRYAILFKPGQYNVDANLGYYETVAGLGRSPDDTNITGAVRVTGQPDPNSPSGISALVNFWRSAENLAVTPTDWSDQWRSRKRRRCAGCTSRASCGWSREAAAIRAAASPTGQGWASYKVGAKVKTHQQRRRLPVACRDSRHTCQSLRSCRRTIAPGGTDGDRRRLRG
jgi:hypothetical protein